MTRQRGFSALGCSFSMLAYTCLYLPMPILVDLAQWEQVTDTTRRLPPQAIRLKENHLSTYRMHNCTPLEKTKKQFSTQATWKHNIWGHTTWAQRFVKDDLWPVKNALLVLRDCCTSTLTDQCFNLKTQPTNFHTRVSLVGISKITIQVYSISSIFSHKYDMHAWH